MQQQLAITLVLILALTSMPVLPVRASSHMDAPLITFDDPANTTDVYAFVTMRDNGKYLTTAVAVYPFEDPGIGPNKYNFDDNVLYSIHVATGNDVADGRATYTYDFEFTTNFKSQDTILQSYLGVIDNVDDAAQNLTQTYTVVRENRLTQERTMLGQGVVPPNNQGVATPFYNQDNNGENPAREGVGRDGVLDRYTRESIAELADGYVSFAGQRDDGFYADIQSVFDLLQLRNPGKDSQQGFNVHTIVLDIPISEIGGDQQIVGVYGCEVYSHRGWWRWRLHHPSGERTMMVLALRLQLMGSYTARLLGMEVLALALTIGSSPVRAADAPQARAKTLAELAL